MIEDRMTEYPSTRVGPALVDEVNLQHWAEWTEHAGLRLRVFRRGNATAVLIEGAGLWDVIITRPGVEPEAAVLRPEEVVPYLNLAAGLP
jgi:hypothetical protein